MKSRTTEMHCKEQRHVPFMTKGGLYLWNKGKIYPLSTNTLIRLIMIKNLSQMAPIWENHWVYNSEDFATSDLHYLSIREIEQREQTLEEQENVHYNEAIRLPLCDFRPFPR